MTETGQTDCGCPDWRTDADLEAEFASDASNVFPTGLFPSEWAPALKEDLNRAAEQAETDAAWAAAKAARAKARARFTTETTSAAEPEPEPACAATDPEPPPFLTRPIGRPVGTRTIRTAQPEPQTGIGPSPCPYPADHPAHPTSLR
ncbi:hypothetical protein GCM10029992_21790 [Glycomyces albus]